MISISTHVHAEPKRNKATPMDNCFFVMQPQTNCLPFLRTHRGFTINRTLSYAGQKKVKHFTSPENHKYGKLLFWSTCEIPIIIHVWSLWHLLFLEWSLEMDIHTSLGPKPNFSKFTNKNLVYARWDRPTRGCQNCAQGYLWRLLKSGDSALAFWVGNCDWTKTENFVPDSYYEWISHWTNSEQGFTFEFTINWIPNNHMVTQTYNNK